MSEYIYIARADPYSITKAVVAKETPKTFLLSGKFENIMGRNSMLNQGWPTRLLKRQYSFFDSAQNALVYLRTESKMDVSRCERWLKRARANRDDLSEFELVESEEPK